MKTDTVSRYRKELGASVEIGQMDQPRTVARGGKVYSMETARIGRQAAGPAGPPAEPAAPTPSDHAGNVVMLGSRLTIMPSPQAVERAGSWCCGTLAGVSKLPERAATVALITAYNTGRR